MALPLALAARCTRDGSIRLTVAAERRRQGEGAAPGWVRLCFEVADSGRGIPEEDLKRIFRPFERLDEAGHGEGLGLGLPIARQIVRAMGGEIEVDSRLGRGSRFRFGVELDLATEADIPLALPELEVVGYSGPTRRLLLVEDHAANRRLIEDLLSELGFEVQAAVDVAAGLAAIRAKPFDLLLLDQRLPDGTGWDVLQGARGGVGNAATPAILLSALPPAPPPHWGEAPAFEAVLLKPVAAGELLRTLESVLGLSWTLEDKPLSGRCATAGPGSEALEAFGRPPAVGAEGSPDALPRLAELAALAEEGAVYELEDWVARARRLGHPDAALCSAVEQRLAVLDFEGIRALAASPASPQGA